MNMCHVVPNHQNTRDNMLGKLKECLKRRFSTDDLQRDDVKLAKVMKNIPLPFSKYLLIAPSSPITMESERQVAVNKPSHLPEIKECLVIENGKVVKFVEKAVIDMWNYCMFTLNTCKAPLSNVQYVLQTFNYFKHLCNFPNLQMALSSKDFLIKHVFSEIGRIIIEYPKIFDQCHGIRLCILLLHILMYDQPFKSFDEEDNGFKQFVAINNLLYCDCDKAVFHEFIEVHCGSHVKDIISSSETESETLDSEALLVSTKWFPLLSTAYKKGMIDNVIVPMLTSKIQRFTFVDLENILDILEPWQQLIGNTHMTVLQKYAANCAISSLEGTSWLASDLKVFLLFNAIFPFICEDQKDRFIQRTIVPAIQRELIELGKLSAPFVLDVFHMWQNVMSWKVFFSYETLCTVVVVYYLPQLIIWLSRWVSSRPHRLLVQFWIRKLLQLIPVEMQESICVQRYLMIIGNILKHYHVDLRQVPMDTNLSGSSEPLDLSSSHSIVKPVYDLKNTESCDETDIINVDDGTMHFQILREVVEYQKDLSTTIKEQPSQIHTSLIIPETPFHTCVKMHEENRDLGEVNIDIVDKIPRRDVSNRRSSNASSRRSSNASTITDIVLPPIEQGREVEPPLYTAQPRTPSIPVLHHLSSVISLLQRNTNHVVTYRQMLQETATQFGVNFDVIPKKFKNDCQVYRFGVLKLYIQSGKIFVKLQKNNTWTQTKLSQIHKLL